MALNKSGINLILALVVTALALTAGSFLYLNRDHLAVTPAVTGDSPVGAQPENHPPAGMAEQLAALEKMSEKDPQNPDHQTQVANLYYDLGQFDKAIPFYQRSLKLRPGNPNVETDLAVCFFYLGQNDQALETLDNVLRYSPNFVHAMFNKGIMLASAKKDAKGAIAVWEDLLRTNPDYPQRAEVERRIRELKDSAY